MSSYINKTNSEENKLKNKNKIQSVADDQFLDEIVAEINKNSVENSKESKKHLKRLRQKQKQSESKCDNTTTTIIKSSQCANTENKKTSRNTAVLKERLTKQKEEIERLKHEEEERKQRELNYLRLEEEAKQKENEARELRLQEKQKRRAELKKAGKLLTAAQKAQQAKNRLFIGQLKTSGQNLIIQNSYSKAEVDKSVQENEFKCDISIEDIKLTQEEEKQFETSPVDSETEEEQVLESWEDIEEQEKRKKENRAKQLAQKKTAMEQKRKLYLEKRLEELRQKLQKEQEEIVKKNELRSPICCILGHVDTGKTKLLDNIRQTNVQNGEAGGITQQIGATYMPLETLKQKLSGLNKSIDYDYKIPGLLVIDTPGHESFNNLRSRGSSLCDIAILVVDIMAGLEQQTIESINLLKNRKTPFIVALNKIDRCYGWEKNKNSPLLDTLAKQKQDSLDEFEKRAQHTLNLLTAQGLNCCLYYKNKNFSKYVSVVPTSAITGEGIPDLIMLLIQLTQDMMNSHLKISYNRLECTVLEVKIIDGLGATVDVILRNGVLHQGDTIVLCGLQGAIVTSIRALLTPPPMFEMRVKTDYVHHKLVKASMGVKICAQQLENAIAGSQILLWNKVDDINELKIAVQQELDTILSHVDRSGKGVYVQASTLGSLEALIKLLSSMKIPVSGIQIGPVYKKDVNKCSVMLEHKPEYAVILAFDVKVVLEAQEIADKLGVKIFTADTIYKLCDQYLLYMEKIKNSKRVINANETVFPVVMDIIPNAIFNMKEPIIIGCRIVEGIAKIGTPLCVPAKNNLMIGKITGLQKNSTEITEAKKGEQISVKIEKTKEETSSTIIFNRHFDASHQIVSKLTRESIDLLKEHCKDQLTDDDWRTVIKLKKVFDIL